MLKVKPKLQITPKITEINMTDVISKSYKNQN